MARLSSAPFKRCIFLLLDGVRPDLLDRLVQEGKLPHIEKLFFESGEHRRATSVFPTTTGPAYLPFLTGCFPGTCNLPGIRWLDKGEYQRNRWSLQAKRSYVGLESYLLNRDISGNVTTLFEMLHPNSSVFSLINRGVDPGKDAAKFSRSPFLVLGKFAHIWLTVDRVARRLMHKAIRPELKFLFVAFLAVDEISHLTDPFSPRTLAAYVELDASVGVLVEELKRQRMFESTLIVASSDHGLTQTSQHLELWKTMDEGGFKTLYHPRIFRSGINAACMVSGNSMAHLYFRNRHGWEEPLTRNELKDVGILDAILANDEVDQVMVRDEGGGSLILNREGEALVQEKDGEISYQVTGRDPLGLKGHADKSSLDASLNTSFSSDYPDGPTQVAQLFRSQQVGDMVVTAKLNCDLRKNWEIPAHHASHGSLHREHMMVPLFSNARLSREGATRTVDVFPTILDLLGEPLPDHPIDGSSLVR